MIGTPNGARSPFEVLAISARVRAIRLESNLSRYFKLIIRYFNTVSFQNLLVFRPSIRSGCIFLHYSGLNLDSNSPNFKDLTRSDTRKRPNSASSMREHANESKVDQFRLLILFKIFLEDAKVRLIVNTQAFEVSVFVRCTCWRYSLLKIIRPFQFVDIEGG